MDDASSELLRHLAGRLASPRGSSARRGDPCRAGFSAADGTPPVPALTMRLEPLPPTTPGRSCGPPRADVPDEEADAIAARAGGNPLFLQELVAARTEARRREERSCRRASRRS